MLSVPFAAACSNGGQNTHKSAVGTPGAGNGSDDEPTDTGDRSPVPSPDAVAIAETAEHLHADLTRAFADTPFAHLADEVAAAVHAIAAACDGADPLLSGHVRATLTGAVVPVVAWGTDLLQREDLDLDAVVATAEALGVALSVDQATITAAWAALQEDPTYGPQLDTMGALPDFATLADADTQTLEAYLFTARAFDIPQVQRVVMMQKWLLGTLHDGVDISVLDGFAGPPPPPPDGYDIRDCASFKQADAELGMWLGNPTNADASLFYPGHLAMGLLAVSLTMSVLTAGVAAPLMVPLIVAMGNLLSLATIAMAAVASSILTVAASCECD